MKLADIMRLPAGSIYYIETADGDPKTLWAIWERFRGMYIHTVISSGFLAKRVMNTVYPYSSWMV